MCFGLSISGRWLKAKISYLGQPVDLFKLEAHMHGLTNYGDVFPVIGITAGLNGTMANVTVTPE